MNQNLLKFFEDISKDEVKLKKLFSYEGLDEMYDYAISESKENFTKEEFEEGLNGVISLSESIKSGEISKEDLESGEIDEEILSKVSGGAGQETGHRSAVLGLAAVLPFALSLYGIIKGAIDSKKQKKALEEFKKTDAYKKQMKLQELKTDAEILQYMRELGMK